MKTIEEIIREASGDHTSESWIDILESLSEGNVDQKKAKQKKKYRIIINPTSEEI